MDFLMQKVASEGQVTFTQMGYGTWNLVFVHNLCHA